MANFTIVHVSDLHIGKAHPTDLDVLQGAVAAELKDAPHPRLLVVTGDLVDTPSAVALAAAQSFLEKLRSTAGLKDVLIVRGNHDAKRVLGNFFLSTNFSSVFNTATALREPNVHVIGVDSNAGLFARGRISKPEYNRFLQEVSKTGDDGTKPVRIVAVHHHPLPLANGEGFRELGLVRDEAYMYLESPATFLEACASVGVPLILHGHRHVRGYVRYSIPVQRPITSNDDMWQNIYVLACPSSTGVSAEPAGFNIITPKGRALQIKRLQRQRSGDFQSIDKHLPYEALTLPLSIESIIDLDVAFRVANDMQHRFVEKPAPETELYGHIASLFARRAFTATDEDSPADLLYAVITTHHVWQNTVFPTLRPARHEAAAKVLAVLCDFEDILCRQLAIGTSELDGWRNRYIYDKLEFIKRVPQVSSAMSLIVSAKQQFLARLDAALREMGITILHEQVRKKAPPPAARSRRTLAPPEPEPASDAQDASHLWKQFLRAVDGPEFQENWNADVFPLHDEIIERLKEGNNELVEYVLDGFKSGDTAVVYLASKQLASVRDESRYHERIKEALAPIATGKHPHARFYAYGLLHYLEPNRWTRAELERLFRADKHEICVMINIYGKQSSVRLTEDPEQDTLFERIYSHFQPSPARDSS